MRLFPLLVHKYKRDVRHIRSVSRISSKSKSSFDILGDFRKLELISSEHKLLLLSYLGSMGKNKDDIKPRYIIEVTKLHL